MAACPKCGAACSEDARFCAHCGAVIGPDAGALERLIDERARAVVEEQKAQEKAERHRVEEDQIRQRQREGLERCVSEAREALEKNEREPTVVGSCVRSMKHVALVALFIGLFPGAGMILHMFLIPAIGTSPAGVVCPLVCDGCSAPARTFSWNYRGSWHPENGRMGYAFICTNPKIDVRALSSWSDVVDRKTNEALQPYMLSSFVAWMAEVAIVVPIVALVLGPLFGLRRRRRAVAERPALVAALERARRELEEFDQPPAAEPIGPYR